MLRCMHGRIFYKAFIRLRQDEYELLHELAKLERRQMAEQASVLVSQGLARWQAQRRFEESLPEDEDPFPAELTA
jgi:hypothetical protein